nr:MAG TPA: hypothetical protein [Caudoviricetes sp.]
MLEVVMATAAAGVTALGGLIVAWYNSRSAKEASTLASYEQLAKQVASQQTQVKELFAQVTELSSRVVTLETRNAAWQAWADDLNLRWSEWRAHLEPPGYPTHIRRN